MTDTELRKLKAEFPTALMVWYDNMHELPTGMLIETLLVHMPKSVLGVSLMNIDSTIETIREEEKQDGDRETTE
jgi:hypothetical protein